MDGGGGKVQFNVCFLTWMHCGRQGLALEPLNDFQDHFYMILTKFGSNCGSLFATKKADPKTPFYIVLRRPAA